MSRPHPAGPARQSRLRLLLSLACAVVLASLIAPAGCFALVYPATTIDGPSNEVLEVDGAAMAPDGSGGIVYRKRVGGVAHVFVVPFAAGRWGAPVRVDGESSYPASTPAIAAGDGGRLLVVWVQPRNVNSKGVTLYELVGASQQPGSSSFGQSIIIDPSVGEPNTGEAKGIDPALAMAPSSGQAYVVYRVTTNECYGREDPTSSSCAPGTRDELVSVKVARYNYLLWSSLGGINRAPQIAMRAPTAENAPAIGIDSSGNGIVAWQEPGSDGVARIWMRRLFGGVLGNVLQASPETIGGRPVGSDAEAPALAVSPLGEARIVYRIAGAAGAAVPETQLFTNSIQSTVSPSGAQPTGASALAGTAAHRLGAPSAAIDQRGDFRFAWTQEATVRELAGAQGAGGSPQTIGAAAGAAPTTINPAGGGTTAWVASAGGSPTVDVREDYSQGAFQLAQLAGGVAGPIEGLAVGGSGEGDALLAWTQGPPGQAEVVGDFVQAPPAPFMLSLPVGWVRARSARLTWESSSDAVAGVSYSVYVDGTIRLHGLTGLSARLPSAALGDGIHHLQVLATDASGQQTMSAAGELKIDANPPIVHAQLTDSGRGVHVTVRDRASGVDVRATKIFFGDGAHVRARARVTHRYARPGTYALVAYVRDRAGNSATVRLRVRVR